MNSKKVGAVALSAVALVVLVSGCAGVRSQVEAGSGQSSITSLSQQAQTQHREAAEAREHARPRGPPRRVEARGERGDPFRQADRRQVRRHPQPGTGGHPR